ncbi:MAG TPA: VIT domain-containing protein [Gemmatimonadales bacterium]|nr:VIT domain-containing protein [Gemmatimonadales bacterium]
MRSLPALLLSLPLAALPVAAQGWIAPDRPVPGPVRSSPLVVRTESDVRVTIDGRVARVEVTERFRNNGRTVAEGTYHYPLPRDAVFNDFSLFQGEQELKGEMLTAEQARSIYEAIVSRLRDPALLTLAGHGLIRAQVFPIQPGETRTVILRYSQVLEREGDAVRLRYAAGQRGEAPVTMNLTATPEADFSTAYSPTHPITERRQGGRLRIEVGQPIHGDVELLLPLRRTLIGGTVLAHRDDSDDGYALLFLAPPPATVQSAIGRDLTFVVDISGSMSGRKMEQARTALRQALDNLGSNDRFRMIAFSGSVREFRDGWSPATAAMIASAGQFIDRLNPNGGTNIEAALDAALSASSPASRMSLVFFVTDGLPSVGEQQPDRLAATAAGRIGRSRVFTFGVGHDVNTYLLDRLAVEGRGSSSYVAPDADVSDAVGGVLGKLSRPAITDLRIVSAPVRFIDQAPAELPDLFFGEELVLLTRYRGIGSGAVVIEGSRDGRRERFTIRTSFPARSHDHGYIPQLWASRRIGDLTRQIRLEGSTTELIATIRDLGLKHGIITEYTSYLVQEPQMVASRQEARPAPISGAAAAPMMTGARAFEDASITTTMSASKTVAEAEAAVAGRARDLARRDGTATEVRRAGGRLFALRNGVWTDAAHRDSLRITSVAPFSRAYFDLVAARPGLAEALAIGAPAILAGDRASLRIADGGITTWTRGALDRFLQEFDRR